MITDKQIEVAVQELAKLSTAPDKECPTWMEADIRNGIKKGIEMMGGTYEEVKPVEA